MTELNPKQAGSNLRDCIPQRGPCPLECPECFYNRPGAFFAGLEPLIPSAKEIGNTIVRVNSGNDSNVGRELVIKTAQKYKHYFFNTSLPNLNFPGPVVLTANARNNFYIVPKDIPINLMFVRLLVAADNLQRCWTALREWTDRGVTVVLTFQRFSSEQAAVKCVNGFESVINIDKNYNCFYELKKHILNEWWCPTKDFVIESCRFLELGQNRLVSLCGTFDSSLCKDCRNCELYYWITLRRIQEAEALEQTKK